MSIKRRHLKIALSRQVDAIIPGYGFLSENAEFAQSVAKAGMVFVGPKPDAIEAFGLKHRAREMAVRVGVPIVPGTRGLLATEEETVRAADDLGYPVGLLRLFLLGIMNDHLVVIGNVKSHRRRGWDGPGYLQLIQRDSRVAAPGSISRSYAVQKCWRIPGTLLPREPSY
jgi:Pyruvate carboxylase